MLAGTIDDFGVLHMRGEVHAYYNNRSWFVAEWNSNFLQIHP